jgi:predicted AAA+ superfamily ATPase
MGGALFEGWVISEAMKVFAMKGKRADIFYWRSHDGLEVDLIVQAGGKLHPLEIKLTATPTLKHLDPINRFKQLAGPDTAEEGILVCRIDKETPMPFGNLALPWHAFPAWLMSKL